MIMLSSFRGNLTHYIFVKLLYFFNRMLVKFDNSICGCLHDLTGLFDFSHGKVTQVLW